jgi:hypothetical protein
MFLLKSNLQTQLRYSNPAIKSAPPRTPFCDLVTIVRTYLVPYHFTCQPKVDALSTSESIKMSTEKAKMEIPNPRRILAVSLADSAQHLSHVIRGMRPLIIITRSCTTTHPPTSSHPTPSPPYHRFHSDPKN